MHERAGLHVRLAAPIENRHDGVYRSGQNRQPHPTRLEVFDAGLEAVEHEDEHEQERHVCRAAGGDEEDGQEKAGNQDFVHRMDGALDVSHAEDCLTQPIRRNIEPSLFVGLASVGADDAHAVDPFDHPVRQLGIRSRDALAELASALREEPHDARDEEHPERDDECQAPGHQDQQHDVHDDRAGRDDQMDENLQRFARPPGIGREDVQQSSRAIPFDCTEAHGQQLIEDAAAQLMRDPAVHPRKKDAVRVRQGRCG